MIKFFAFLVLLTGSAVSAAQGCNKSNFIIAIDIGHSQKRAGAISARGIEEFYFNQNLGNLLLRTLLEQGFGRAFLVNPNGEDMSLSRRARIATHMKSDLFISLHHDSVQPRYLSRWMYEGQSYLYSDIFNGFSIFYSESGDQAQASLYFAYQLGNALVQRRLKPTLHHAEPIKGENRDLVEPRLGIYRFDELVVLKKATMPAVLLESGIIVNRQEEVLLNNPIYQRTIVSGIIQAIENSCQLKKTF